MGDLGDLIHAIAGTNGGNHSGPATIGEPLPLTWPTRPDLSGHYPLHADVVCSHMPGSNPVMDSRAPPGSGVIHAEVTHPHARIHHGRTALPLLPPFLPGWAWFSGLHGRTAAAGGGSNASRPGPEKQQAS